MRPETRSRPSAKLYEACGSRSRGGVAADHRFYSWTGCVLLLIHRRDHDGEQSTDAAADFTHAWRQLYKCAAHATRELELSARSCSSPLVRRCRRSLLLVCRLPAACRGAFVERTAEPAVEIELRARRSVGRKPVERWSGGWTALACLVSLSSVHCPRGHVRPCSRACR